MPIGILPARSEVGGGMAQGAPTIPKNSEEPRFIEHAPLESHSLASAGIWGSQMYPPVNNYCL